MKPPDAARPPWICVASYPKSGNTWIRLALHACFHGGRLDSLRGWEADSLASFEAARFQTLMGVDPRLLSVTEILGLLPAYLEQMARTAPSLQVVKVHDAGCQPGGSRLLRPGTARLVVHMVRDPRDVAVSWAHYSACPIDRVIDRMAGPGTILGAGAATHRPLLPQYLGTWSEHVLSWLEAPADPPVLTLRYEDRLADPAGTLRTVVHRAGLDIEPETVAAAVEASAFGRVAAMEETEGFRERPSAADRFFRQGRAGGWRDALTVAQIARIEADHGPVMRQLGYSLAMECP